MTAEVHVTTAMDGTPTFIAESDEHDDAVAIAFRGVTVTITLRSIEEARRTGTDETTALVLIDTEPDTTVPISIQINDDPTWEGIIQ